MSLSYFGCKLPAWEDSLAFSKHWKEGWSEVVFVTKAIRKPRGWVGVNENGYFPGGDVIGLADNQVSL